MNSLEKTLFKIDFILKQNSIDYVIIGGIAVIIHGKFRTTKDIDVTLLTDLDSLDSLYNIISTNYKSIFEDSKTFFKQNFILPVYDNETGFRIDFAAGLSEFDKNAVERKVQKQINNIMVNVCSVEDLLLYKLFGARPQDFIDVEDLIKTNKESLDLNYLKKIAENFREVDREDVLQNLNRYLNKKD